MGGRDEEEFERMLLIELSSIETTNTLQPLNHPLLF